MAAALAVSACTGGSSGRNAAMTESETSTDDDAGSMGSGIPEDTGRSGSATGGTDAHVSTTDTGPQDTVGNDNDDDDNDDDNDSGATSGGELGDWLLTIDNAAAPPSLVRINVATGAGEARCVLPGASTFNSLMLAPDGTLFVHNATQARIDRVDPCDCGFAIVGSTSAGPLKIGPDGEDGMFGIDSGLNALFAIDASTGLANPVGPLGVDVSGSAITFSEALPGLMAIDDANNQLYSVDTQTGAASLIATLSISVTTPGFAYRRLDDTLYVCQADVLYTLGADSGILTPVGPIGLVGDCTSLAAPRRPDACLD